MKKSIFCAALSVLLLLTACQAPRAEMLPPWQGGQPLPRVNWDFYHFQQPVDLNFPKTLPAFVEGRSPERAKLSKAETDEIYNLGMGLAAGLLLCDNWVPEEADKFLNSIKPYLVPEKLKQLEENNFFTDYGKGRITYGFSCQVYSCRISEDGQARIALFPGETPLYMLQISASRYMRDGGSGFVERYFHVIADASDDTGFYIFFRRDNGHFLVVDWAGGIGGYAANEE